MTERLAYSAKSAAKALDVSERTIWRAVRRGDLTTFKVLGSTRIPAEQIDALKGTPPNPPAVGAA